MCKETKQKVSSLVMDLMKESSIKEEQPGKNAISGVQVTGCWVKTIAILTAEDPNTDDAVPHSQDKRCESSRKEQRRRSLREVLQNSGYLYKPICGNGHEDSESVVVIFNISPDAAAYFGKHYRQSSFLFCRKQEHGGMDYEYWERSNHFEAPVKVEHAVTDANDEKDLCLPIFNRLELGIPFQFKPIENRIGQLITEGRESRVVEKLLSDSMYLGGFKGYMSRKTLYHGKGLLS